MTCARCGRTPGDEAAYPGSEPAPNRSGFPYRAHDLRHFGLPPQKPQKLFGGQSASVAHAVVARSQASITLAHTAPPSARKLHSHSAGQSAAAAQAQPPRTQSLPGGQARSQAPQLAESVWTSRQPPVQQASPPRQLISAVAAVALVGIQVLALAVAGRSPRLARAAAVAAAGAGAAVAAPFAPVPHLAAAGGRFLHRPALGRRAQPDPQRGAEQLQRAPPRARSGVRRSCHRSCQVVKNLPVHAYLLHARRCLTDHLRIGRCQRGRIGKIT